MYERMNSQIVTKYDYLQKSQFINATPWYNYDLQARKQMKEMINYAFFVFSLCAVPRNL